MRSLAPVLLLVLTYFGVVEGADSNVAPEARADCTFEGAQSYEKELIDRIAILESKLDEEAKARLAERATAASSLATARKEMAARLETMSGELRTRELDLNRSTESLKNLRASVAECSESLELAHKKGSDLNARRLAEESHEKELAERIATLERQLAEEAKARLGERAAAGSSLATARKEMAARLETMSGELRTRMADLDRSTESMKTLRASVAECSERMELARKKGSDLEARRAAAESALRDAEATRDNAVASEKTATADAAEQRASAARASARADELEHRLSDAAQRIATLEKNLSVAKETARAAEIESQKARSNAEREVAALQGAIASKTNENALLTKRLDEQKALQSSTKAVTSERDSLVKDLAKARAEIARLNDVNIERQALIDEKGGGAVPGDNLPSRKTSPKEERRESATRARNARPLLAVRASGDPSQRAQDSRADDLAKALARRDEIQHAIDRLEGSPADQGAPAKAVELEAELDSLNLEIRRLTILLGDADLSSP